MTSKTEQTRAFEICFDGIKILQLVCTLKNSELTIDDALETRYSISKLIGDQKVFIIFDCRSSPSARRKNREFTCQELAQFIKAGASITDSKIGKFFGNLSLRFNPLPFPSKMVNSHDEALMWFKSIK